MTIEEWNSLAADPRVQARISADPILTIYGIVLSHFTSRGTLTWDDAVIGLHITYAWMPTIPDLSRPAGLNAAGRVRVISLLNAARSRTLAAGELDTLKNDFCNNSMVGVSKMLHFLNAAQHPIWDSRVAKAWYAPRKAYPYTYEKPAEYLGYAQQVLAWSRSPHTAVARNRIRALSPSLNGVSDLRLIELVLFHS